MSREERNTYTIKGDENLGEVKIADEVVAIIVQALPRWKWTASLPWRETRQGN